jgi:hypothetical protein
MIQGNRAARTGNHVAAIVLVCLVPAVCLGQNASNGLQASGPTNLALETAAAETTSTAALTGGTQSVGVMTGTVGVLAPGFSIVLDRGKPNQETDQAATPGERSHGDLYRHPDA